MTVFTVPDPLTKLPALAERLGVEPTDKSSSATVLLRVSDGRQYDLFDLFTAVLDRLDAAATGENN